MAKKRLELSVQDKPQKKNVKHIKDSKINFSDSPELSNKILRSARRVGRPKSQTVKHLIAIRLSPKLLTEIRTLAKKKNKPYQSLMHELLEKAVKTAA